MTTALVPYDPAFAQGQNQTGYYFAFVGHQFAQIGRVLTKFACDFGIAWGQIVDRITAAFMPLAYELAPEALLPNPAELLCGHVEIHPVDGTKWRVAGRRNNRHWIRSGPRRVRWWK